MGHPWADFLSARLRLIHEWAKEGKSAETICADLNHHDVGQIRLLLLTPPEAAIPGSVYEWVKRLEGQVLQTGLTVEAWAAGEATPEYALRHIRRELKAVLAKMTDEVKG